MCSWKNMKPAKGWNEVHNASSLHWHFLTSTNLLFRAYKRRRRWRTTENGQTITQNNAKKKRQLSSSSLLSPHRHHRKQHISFGCPSNHHSNDGDDVFFLFICSFSLGWELMCAHLTSTFNHFVVITGKARQSLIILYSYTTIRIHHHQPFILSLPRHTHTHTDTTPTSCISFSRCVHVNNKKKLWCARWFFSFFHFSGASIDKVPFLSPSFSTRRVSWW